MVEGTFLFGAIPEKNHFIFKTSLLSVCAGCGRLSRLRRISQSDNEHRRSDVRFPQMLHTPHQAKSCDDRVRWGCDIPATVIGLVSVASEGSIGSVMINCRLPPGKRPSERRCLVGWLLSQLEPCSDGIDRQSKPGIFTCEYRGDDPPGSATSLLQYSFRDKFLRSRIVS